MSDKENSKIDVGEFIQSNSELFVVLGVFSALAIYISQLQEGPLSEAPIETRVGFAGALILAVLMVFLIYRELIEKAGSVEELLQAHARISNLDLILFTTGVLFLLPSLINPLSQRQYALYYILVVVGLLLSIPVIFDIILIIQEKSPENEYYKRNIYIITGAVSVYISDRSIRYIRSGKVPIGADQFSLGNTSPVFFDILATLSLLVGTIGIVSVIFSSLDLLAILYSDVRNYYDEFHFGFEKDKNK